MREIKRYDPNSWIYPNDPMRDILSWSRRDKYDQRESLHTPQINMVVHYTEYKPQPQTPSKECRKESHALVDSATKSSSISS